MPKKIAASAEVRAEEVLRRRVRVRAQELVSLIHEINPTGRELSPDVDRRRYGLKSKLQSLLVREFRDDLAVEPVDETGARLAEAMLLQSNLSGDQHFRKKLILATFLEDQDGGRRRYGVSLPLGPHTWTETKLADVELRARAWLDGSEAADVGAGER